MPSHKNIRAGTARRARFRAAALGLLATVAGTSFAVACSTADLLTVQVPNSVPLTLFNDPINATLMANSAIGDFEFAFDAFVQYEGIATDELQDATPSQANWPLDRRDNNANTALYGTAMYTPLAIARQEADAAIHSLSGWTDAQVANRSTLLAEMNLYAGFSYAVIGMSMCQAAFDLGPAVSQLGIFVLAEARFTSAIAAAQTAGNTNLLNAAYAGRARVRLYQHNTAGAATDAALVPKGFVFNANMDATNARRFNSIYALISTAGNGTVDVTSRALTTETGQADPRSATVLLTTKAFDGVSPIYIPVKYNGASLTAGEAIPLPIARYEEAQLILAEAQGGAAAVTIINALRAAVVPALNPYTGATDAASIKNLIVSERQRVLFVEGFRAFDIERFNLPLVPAVGTAYRLGAAYGGTVCLPMPSVEFLNNTHVVRSTLIDGVQGDFPVP
jgi:hypothetical protein